MINDKIYKKKGGQWVGTALLYCNRCRGVTLITVSHSSTTIYQEQYEKFKLHCKIVKINDQKYKRAEVAQKNINKINLKA